MKRLFKRLQHNVQGLHGAEKCDSYREKSQELNTGGGMRFGVILVGGADGEGS